MKTIKLTVPVIEKIQNYLRKNTGNDEIYTPAVLSEAESVEKKYVLKNFGDLSLAIQSAKVFIRFFVKEENENIYCTLEFSYLGNTNQSSLVRLMFDKTGDLIMTY